MTHQISKVLDEIEDRIQQMRGAALGKWSRLGDDLLGRARSAGYEPLDVVAGLLDLLDESRNKQLSHCWEEGPRDENDVGSTCFLLDGHDGPHEFTSDSAVQIKFASAENGGPTP